MGKPSSFDKLDDTILTRLAEIWPQPYRSILDDIGGQPAIDPFIYHYTDVNGLKGILQSNCLWASAAQYLNDSSEVEYGCSLVVEELLYWLDLNRGVESFLVKILKNLRIEFSRPASRDSRGATVFVACFCENGNLLSQWRAYGQQGGYALGFEIEQSWPTASLKVADSSWETRLERVIYSPLAQRRRINALLGKVFGSLRELAPDFEGLADMEAKLLLLRVTRYFTELLIDEIATFKNPAFREENEWRLIVRPRWIDAEEAPVSSPAPKFRNARGSLVPYLELHPGHGKLPIRAVRYGPSLVKNRVEAPLALLLETCGFEGVRITGSDLPVIL